MVKGGIKGEMLLVASSLTFNAEIIMKPIFKAARYPDYGPAYSLALSADQSGTLKEGARVRFSWNDDGFNVFAELEDSSCIATNPRDEELHYQYGDVFELFLKPRHDTYYWEMYAVPSGNKSTLFFPRDRSGMELNDFLKGHVFRSLDVSVEKTSSGWNARMFVPVAQLTALGAGWGDGTEWTLFCGRYNYQDEHLMNPELSMVPAISQTNFHLTDEYAQLYLCAN